MRNTLKGKNLDIPGSDRSYAQRKLRRLDRLLDDRSEAVVEFSIESHRSAETSHIVEVSLVVNGRTLRGTASAATHRAAIDDVVDKLERQAVSHKRRPMERRRVANRKLDAVAALEADAAAAETNADQPPQVVKSKRFAIEPMFEEDAVARMEELGHSFFIFVNAETEQIAVLYRRRDGNYGLIEPTIGGEYTPGAAKRRRSG